MKKMYFMDKTILLWIFGSTLSAFGDVFTSTAIPLVTFNLTKSAKFSALVLFLDILPIILLSPFIGSMVDKISKKRIIFFSNMVSIVILVSFLFIKENEWYYLVGNTMITISAKFYSTAAKTMLPDIISDNDIITRVNSLISLTLKVARILGASLAAVVLSTWGTTVLFIFDAVSFGANIICVLSLKVKNTNIEKKDKKQNEKYHFIDSVKYFSVDKLFLAMSIIYAGLFFIEGLMQSQMVVFIKKYLRLGDTHYAIYQNCVLIGVVGGQVLLSKYEMKVKEFFWEKVGVFILIGSLIGIFVFKQVFFGVLYGVGQPLIVTSWYSYFYKHTPKAISGRLLAFSGMCFDVVHLISVTMVYFVCDYLKPQESLLLTGGVLLFIVVVTSSIVCKSQEKSKCEITRC